MAQELTNNSQKAVVKEYFEKYSQDWQSIYSAEDLPSVIIQERQDYTLNYVDRLGLGKGAKVLDLGCGTGLTSAKLLQRGFNVIGIDVSKKMLELARRNCCNCTEECNAVFQLGDVEDLGLKNDSFDAVIAMGVVEYLKWDRWALQEMHRILKPGGYLIVTVPNRIRLVHLTDPNWLISLVKKEARRILKKGLTWIFESSRFICKFEQIKVGSTISDTMPRNLYTPFHLKRMLTGLDYEILDSVSHGFGPFRVLGRSNGLSLKLNAIFRKCLVRNRIPFLSNLGSNYIVLCRKRRQPSQIDKRHIFSGLNKRIKMFESEQRKLFWHRKTWLKKYREYRHLNLKELDVRDFSCKNVLIISPHPDDEIIGCGGTLIKMLQWGSTFAVLQMTDGRNTVVFKDFPEDIRKTIRLEEAKEVADSLGFTELILWKEEDSHLKCTPDNVRKLTDILERLHPKAIFVPFLNDIHPDHVIANKILRGSLEASTLNLTKVNILSYEVWSLLPPSSFCIIDNQFDKKVEMLMKYRTVAKVVDYVHFCESLNAYRAYTLLGKKGFAEVFLNLNAKAYCSAVRQIEGATSVE